MNKLSTQTSPYLLQHAHNPVHWQPWGKEALDQAVLEDKPIIVSIGYSTCHWCHVMERESFENEEIASVMNQHFVCIKVDREERPDVDAIYMDAIQAMGLQGGWPLNVFLLPNRRPFYGGTYFKLHQWESICQQIATAFDEKRDQLEESAGQFTKNIANSVISKFGLEPSKTSSNASDLYQMYQKLAGNFDQERGGLTRAPKFPMPSLWLFLLRYGHIYKDKNALSQVNLTLEKMALGGIYDQVGGGFARYSVDGDWFCPHFEKMLYDNAQLLQLYSEAYSCTGTHLYKQVVYQTIGNFAKQMTDKNGGFYSALDADSEGVEGKYYVWNYEELKDIIGKHNFTLFEKYYNIKVSGNWEEGENILYRSLSDEDFLLENNMHMEIIAFREQVFTWRALIYEERKKRIPPSTDNKIITSWNALMIHGLLVSYRTFQEDDFLELALNNALFIKNNLLNGDHLCRTFIDGKRGGDAFLDDYALLIKALLALYQATFDDQWLKLSHQLLEVVLRDFYDPKDDFFFFTRHNPEELIAHKKEIFDSVIPSSNATMAHNLYQIALLLDREDYKDIAMRMLGRVKKLLQTDVQYTSAWAGVLLQSLISDTEVAIVGEDCHRYRKILDKTYHPYLTVSGSIDYQVDPFCPILKDREAIEQKTTLYVCHGQRCTLPTSDPLVALDTITNNLL